MTCREDTLKTRGPVRSRGVCGKLRNTSLAHLLAQSFGLIFSDLHFWKFGGKEENQQVESKLCCGVEWGEAVPQGAASAVARLFGGLFRGKPAVAGPSDTVRFRPARDLFAL